MAARSLKYRQSFAFTTGLVLLWTALITLLVASQAFAAPAAKLMPYWTAHNPQSTQTIDHSAWDSLLQKYVRRSEDGINRVAYASVTAADKAALRAYLKRMAAVKVTGLNRNEQRAYWINVYNAITLDLILQRWPVKSIRQINISPGLFSRGPWGKKLFRVEGQNLSLDDIEHRILRPIWRDPRIHYAVNCAALGCPNLQTRAFTAANTDSLMDRGARAFVNHPRGVKVIGDEIHVSSIYRWFRADFGSSDQSIIAHLKKYAKPSLKAKLDKINDIGRDGYDWAINAVR